VLINILDNAIKYSKETPEVTIKTYNEKNLVAISIEDKGIGMSKQAQKQIFEKFYRESTGDIHNVKGHGLGLAYVKRILDYHQAKITVESEKGKGTKFVIKFKNLK
jgi:two-component system phosphate regulon sensor histidine kinase PhoR